MRTFILSILVLGVLYTSVNAQNTLVFSGPNDPIAEISAEVLKEAYQKMGMQIEILNLPAERSLISSNTGRTDGEVNLNFIFR